jgi:hypothetical protein
MTRRDLEVMTRKRPRGDDFPPPEETNPEPSTEGVPNPAPESGSRGLDQGLDLGDKVKQEEVVDSILRSQAPPPQAQRRSRVL